MKTNEMIEKLAGIDALPTLPAFAIEANRIVSDQGRKGNEELSRVIEKDQAMASEVLSIANSALLKGLVDVSDVQGAITRMGDAILMDAVISVPIIKSFSNLDLLDDFDIKQFWVHSISVAITGRRIAEETGMASPGVCFTSGLLHDIGKIALCAYFKDIFKKVWNVYKAGESTFYEAERKVMQTDHSKIGAALANMWKLPSTIVESIEGHHDHRGWENACNSLKIVHFSDVVVNRFEADPGGGCDRFAIHPAVEEELAPCLENADEWRPRVSEEIRKACEIFLG